MKINKFDKNSLGSVEKQILKRLKDIEDDFGITFEAAGARYDDYECTFKIKASIKGKDQDAVNFAKYCELYGLKQSDLGSIFNHNGEAFKLVGLYPNSSKYPFKITRLKDGRSMKFARGIKKYLEETVK